MLLDWVGSTKIDEAALERMKSAGVEIERYHEPHWSHLPRLNNRTHRKILVVDGRVGFTGGVGIADKWRGDAQDAEHWRDTHFRVARPGGGADAVGVHRQLDQGDRPGAARPRLLSAAGAGAGGMPAQMFSSSPSGGAESMHLMYLLADHRGEDEHRALEQLLRARRPDDPRAGRGGQARREGAHHRARADHRFRRRPRAPRAPTGARCSRPACRSPSTSRRCSTARCWWSTAGSSRSARPTSTTGRSASTTRPT